MNNLCRIDGDYIEIRTGETRFDRFSLREAQQMQRELALLIPTLKANLSEKYQSQIEEAKKNLESL